MAAFTFLLLFGDPASAAQPAVETLLLPRQLDEPTTTQVAMLAPTGGDQADGPRRAAPSQARQARTKAKIKQEFAREFATLGQPGSEQALARRILEEAKSAQGDPVRYFTLLNMGATLFARAGDARSAIQAIGKLGEHYKIDAPALQVQAIETAAQAARGRVEEGRIASAGLDLLADLVEANQYDEAQAIVGIVSAAARQSGDPHLRTLAQSRNQRIGQLQNAYEEIESAVEAIQKNPNNPQAQGDLGRFLAFEKQDWEAALPHLKKCDDPALRELAAKDKKNPNSPEARLSLANEWWSFAKRAHGAEERALQHRAAYWYRRALPDLAGTVRAGVLRRLARLSSPRAQLRIQMVDVHGEGIFHLTSEEIRYEHGSWAVPDQFRLNNLVWDPNKKDKVANRGATRFLPEGVVLETVRLVKRQGRGTAMLEIEPGHIQVKFNDVPVTSDDYELLLTFGN